jgi:MoaA/NifB/PqqE/SkfB family radical SAM enzyme
VFNSFALLLTTQCNDWCKVCDYEPVSNLSTFMTETEAINYIEQVSPVIDSFPGPRLEILGGEPFVHLDTLLNVVRYAAHVGFHPEVSTNGFWATNPHATRLVVTRLREAGVRTLVIVTDTYHLRFVSIGNLKNLVDAVRDDGLIITIVYRAMKTDTVPLDILELRSVNTAISEVVFQPWLPVGPPDPINGNVFAIELGLPPPLPCRSRLRLVVSPSGDVYPCLAGTFIPALKLGNAKLHPLARILEDSQHNIRLRSLANLGARGLVSRKAMHKLENDASLLYADNCWLCQKLLSDGSPVGATE